MSYVSPLQIEQLALIPGRYKLGGVVKLPDSLRRGWVVVPADVFGPEHSEEFRVFKVCAAINSRIDREGATVVHARLMSEDGLDLRAEDFAGDAIY